MIFRRHLACMRLLLTVRAFINAEYVTFLRFHSIINTITYEGAIITDNEFDIYPDYVPLGGGLVVLVNYSPNGTDLVGYETSR